VLFENLIRGRFGIPKLKTIWGFEKVKRRKRNSLSGFREAKCGGKKCRDGRRKKRIWTFEIFEYGVLKKLPQCYIFQSCIANKMYTGATQQVPKIDPEDENKK